MTPEMLDAIIAKYGEDGIFGFVFDNNGRVIFKKKPFKKDSNIDNTIECVVIESTDNFNVPYKVLKPIGTIQSVIVADPTDRTKLTEHYIIN